MNIGLMKDKASVTEVEKPEVGLEKFLLNREERRAKWSKCGLMTQERIPLSMLEKENMESLKSLGLKEDEDFIPKCSIPLIGKNFDVIFFRNRNPILVEEIENLHMQTKKECFWIILKNLEKKILLDESGITIPFLLTAVKQRKFKNRTTRFSLDAALLGIEKGLLVSFTEEPFLSQRNRLIRNIVNEDNVNEEISNFKKFCSKLMVKEIRKRRKFLKAGAIGELKRKLTSIEARVLDKLENELNVNVRRKVLLKSKFDTFCIPDGSFNIDNQKWFILIEGKLIEALASSFMIKEIVNPTCKCLCVVTTLGNLKEITNPSLLTKFIDKLIFLNQLQ